MIFRNKHSRLSERWGYAPWVLMGLILSGVLMFVANWEANRQERTLMNSFRGDIADLARISEIVIDDKLRDYDNALLVLRDAYSSDPKRFPENIRLLRSGPLRDLELLVVLVDREGYLAYTDTPNVKPRLYLGNRVYFRYFADGGADSFFIDEPTFGRVTQRYSLPLSRPIFDKQGSFLGVVAISLKQESLAHFDPSMQFAADTMVTVVNHSGSIVSRSRDLAKVQGTKIGQELLTRMLKRSEGVFSNGSTVDGVEHIIAHRHILEDNTPLIIYVEAVPGEVLRIASVQRTVIMSSAGLISILILILIVLNVKRYKVTAQLIDSLRRNKEHEYETLTRTSLDGFWTSDNTGWIRDANDSLCLMLGYTREELLGLSIQDIEASQESSEGIRVNISTVIESGSQRFQSQLRRKDGRIRDVEISSQYAAEPEERCFVFVRDITDRNMAEKVLAASEKKFRDLLESVQLVAVILDAQGNLTFCNDYLLSLTGWSRNEVINKNWFGLFIPEDIRDAVYSIFQSAIRNNSLSLHYENAIIARDKTQRFIVWNNSILRDSEGNAIGVASIGTDVTEHRKLEEQLRQSQKMESIGTLAGGIAHDFNNILTAIIGYGHLTLRKMEKDDPNRLNIEQMLEASDRAAHLTKDLLLFSRKQPIHRKLLDLNEVIKRLEKFLIRVIGEDIAFQTNLSDGEIPILADAHQIEQVLMNLATNARDAMPKGGALTVTTDQIRLDQQFINLYGYGKPGLYAMVTVSDTGEGMDEQTRQKIFEPFYTTKEVGKGTGLGLAVVYGIVRQHEGYVNVDSELGKGTTFRIYLPLVASYETEEKGNAVEEQPVRGTETILLAEDNEAVRNLTLSILKEFGYTVITAVDGEDAVSKYEEHKESIQLLLFDLIMPRKSGKEAYDAIREMNPDVKVLFASGYSPDIVQDKASLGKGTAIIFKPVSPMELLKQVRMVLDKGNG